MSCCLGTEETSPVLRHNQEKRCASNIIYISFRKIHFVIGPVNEILTCKKLCIYFYMALQEWGLSEHSLSEDFVYFGVGHYIFLDHVT